MGNFNFYTLMNFLIAAIWLVGSASSVETNYVVGTGIYDITGPAAEINMVSHSFIIHHSLSEWVSSLSSCFSYIHTVVAVMEVGGDNVI